MKLLSLFLLTIAAFAQNPVTAQYPGALATDVNFGAPKDNSTTALTASMNASQTSFTVASGTPLRIYSFVTIQSEVLQICGIASNTITACSRGSQGTTAAVHAAGVLVRGLIIAAYTNNTNAEVKAVETALGVNLANVFRISGTNTPTGRQAYGGAASTQPVKVGTTLPATCIVGDLFYDSDATAGANLYGCTATDTWTLETGGGGGGGGGISYCADATGSTTAYTCPSASGYTLGAGVRATFVPQTTNTTTTPTVAIAGGLAKTILNSDGTALVAGQLVGGKPYDLEYNGTNQLVMGEHLAAGPTSCLIIDRSTNPPTVDIVTACVPSKTGTNTWTGANDFTGAATSAPNKSGLSASIPATCAVGQTYFKTDATAGQNLFGCTAVNTWSLLGSTGGGAVVTTANQGMWMPGYKPEGAGSMSGFGQTTLTPQYQFVANMASGGLKFTSASVWLLGAEAGKVGRACLMDSSGNLITNGQSDSLSLATGGGKKFVWSTPVTITANFYFGIVTDSSSVVFGSSDSTTTEAAMVNDTGSDTTSQIFQGSAVGSVVCPASVGTRVALVGSANYAFAVYVRP